MRHASHAASIETEFLFALTNPGTERALKREAEVMQLGWRSGYQRRGFVTFKADAPFTWDSLDAGLACARRICLSLGKSATREEAIARLGEVAHLHEAKYQERRMQGIPAAESARLEIGQTIGTVVELAPGEFWAGLHRHAPHCSPDPAGDGGLTMPERSPSRAWLKLEEAARFFHLTFSPQDTVVELGCAPGGVALALLDRGLRVIGVDPAAMAPCVMPWAIPHRSEGRPDEPWFYHCRKPAALVSKRDLGGGVTWFMSDMNQAPEVVLKECERFCRMAPSIRGVLITLKLSDLMQVENKARWMAALTEMGFRSIRLQQLAVHHRELALLATRE